ncbi:unnamed protein product [Blepharisma stoltei]|uniref:Uncharacterized protein n=1 Tax=Blepharisma stoltei TaxID=1481888 RepID=A0AAU9KE67_9CILI|nr:unnamed protein product [Blepharisma stoltei]
MNDENSNSALDQLIKLRQQAEKVLKIKESKLPELQIEEKDRDIANLKAALKAAQKKLQTQEEQHVRMINALRNEIESKDNDLEKLNKGFAVLDAEKQRMQRDLYQAQKSISDLIAEKQETIRSHLQELADLKLKHEQELYIFRKMKR